MISTSNIYQTMKEIFPMMLKSPGNIFQYNGHDHFDIQYGRMETLTPTDKPIIFFHSLDIAGEMVTVAKCYRDKTIAFRCGIKNTHLEESTLETKAGLMWQISRLIELFTPDVLFGIPFSLTINGLTLNKESIAKIGFSNASCSGLTEYRDEDCSCYVTEFVCSYTLSFTNTKQLN